MHDSSTEPDDPLPAFNLLLHQAARTADSLIERALADVQITARQYTLLEAIAHHPDSSQAKISAATAIDRATLADISGRLRRLGLVERLDAPFDRREKILRLTDAGASRLELARQRVASIEEAMISCIPLEQRDNLLDGLARISDISP